MENNNGMSRFLMSELEPGDYLSYNDDDMVLLNGIRSLPTDSYWYLDFVS